MKVNKLISGIATMLRHKEDVFIKCNLCGVELKTFPGTVRIKADHDDAWFFYLAKHHNIIFDIGANIGFTALLAMVQNPNRDYVLVDPNPLALQKSLRNFLHNNLGFKARYYSAFVSDKINDMVKFYTIDSGAAGSMYASHANLQRP